MVIQYKKTTVIIFYLFGLEKILPIPINNHHNFFLNPLPLLQWVFFFAPILPKFLPKMAIYALYNFHKHAHVDIFGNFTLKFF